ncbi:MAG TPA: SPOR domain-containing protein [Candidatus Marinimicrobia bacterium]|nr:SPOR domain-containing protein [Candidatus Neomarinimicrobiota bacterium]
MLSILKKIGVIPGLFIIAMLIFGVQSAFSNEVDAMHRGAGSKKIRALSKAATERFPDDPATKTLEILLEPNGLAAAKGAQAFIEKHSLSKISTWMLIVLADFYAVHNKTNIADDLLRKAIQRDTTIYRDIYYQSVAGRITGQFFNSPGLIISERPSLLYLDTEFLSRQLAVQIPQFSQTDEPEPQSLPDQGKIHLQIGAFSDRRNASLNADFFKTRGFPVKIVPVEQAGSTIYKVWIGNYHTREEALAARDRISNNYNKNSFIVLE